MRDKLRKFLFDESQVYGQIVEIYQTWDQIQKNNSCPEIVTNILGEMISASILLSANLKFDGKIIIQIYGDGPIKFLTAECDSKLRVRATVKISKKNKISENTSFDKLLNTKGKGRLIITLEPKNNNLKQKTYQSMVELIGDSISKILENYMLVSAQLETKFWLAANKNVTKGLLLQKMPETNEINQQKLSDPDLWERTVKIADSLKKKELLETNIEKILEKLYWNEAVRVFNLRFPTFFCSCSKAKVHNMIKILGEKELQPNILKNKNLNINCEYCGKKYVITSHELKIIFSKDM